MNDGTIGDASSGATTRANADTAALFAVLWGIASAGVAGMTVSGGLGASAAADYASHKTVTLPKTLGRALVCYGAGSGLTSRVLGGVFGEENHTLTLSETPTGITSANASQNISVSLPTNQSSATVSSTSILSVQVANAGTGTVWVPWIAGNGWGNQNISSGVNAISVTSSNTGGAAHNNMQPSTFFNVHIKL